MAAYQVAEKLQTAYCNAKIKRDDYFYVSDVLGSDWACGRSNEFAGKPARYLEIVLELAEAKFGALPFNPFEE